MKTFPHDTNLPNTKDENRRLSHLDRSGQLHPSSLIPHLSSLIWCPLLIVYFVTIGGTFWGTLNGTTKILNQCLTLMVVAAISRRSNEQCPMSNDQCPMSNERLGQRVNGSTSQRVNESTVSGQWSIVCRYWSLVTGHWSLLPAPFALCFLLSTWQSADPRLALEGCFQQLWYLLLFFLALAYARRPHGAATLTSGLLIGASVLALWGMAQYLGWWLDLHRDMTPGGQRVVRATLNSHNDFAGYLVLLLPLSLNAALNVENSRWRVVIHRVRTLLLLSCLVLTYSRAGWLGGIVAAVVYLAGLAPSSQLDSCGTLSRLIPVWKRAQAPPTAIVFLLCCLATIIITCYSTPQPIVSQRITGAFTQPDMGISGRSIIWRNAIEMIQQRPGLGWGANLFPLVYPQFTRQNEQRELAFHAHNLFLQYAAEAGVFAALIFLAMVTLTLKQAWSHSSHPLKLPLTAGIVGYLAYSLFNVCTAIPAIHGTFWMMLGALAGLAPSAFCLLPSAFRLLPVAFCLLFLPFVLKTDRAQLDFDAALPSSNPLPHLQEAVALDPQNTFYHAQLALALSRDDKRLPQAVSHYRRALQLMPFDALHHHNLGWCYRRLKQNQQAIAHFRKSISLDKSQPLYYLSLGDALERTGSDDAALQQYETASRLWAYAPMSHVLTARIFARQGRWRQANRAYQSALDSLRSGRAASGCHIPIRYRRIGLTDEAFLPKEWNVTEKDVWEEWKTVKNQQQR
jgi:O-antigen ligase/Tfp pilus assembly protein PilF